MTAPDKPGRPCGAPGLVRLRRVRESTARPHRRGTNVITSGSTRGRRGATAHWRHEIRSVATLRK